MIHIIRKRATPKQIQEMLQNLGTYINIRPHQSNRSLEIVIPDIRKRVAQITYDLLGEL